MFLETILPMFQHTFTFPDSTIETLEKRVKYVLTFQKSDFRSLHEIAVTKLRENGRFIIRCILLIMWIFQIVVCYHTVILKCLNKITGNHFIFNFALF